jgi:hypothetical protein
MINGIGKMTGLNQNKNNVPPQHPPKGGQRPIKAEGVNNPVIVPKRHRDKVTGLNIKRKITPVISENDIGEMAGLNKS